MPLIDPAIALSTRQEAFCRHYAVSGNAADAARQAGSALLERPYTSGLYFGLIGRLRHHIVAPDPIRGPSPDLATCLGGADGALPGASPLRDSRLDAPLRSAMGPGSQSYRIHTSLPGGAALHYPNRLPSQKRGSPRTPIRGPSSVLAADSAVDPVLHRLRRHRKSGMGPRLRGGDEKGANARAARTAGAPQTSRNEMCACGRIAVWGDPRFREGRRWVRREAWVPANDRWYYIVGRVRRIRMSWRRTARDETQEGFDEDACARTAGRLMATVEERESPPVCFELPEQAPANDLPLADDPPEDRDFAPDHDKT